MIPLRDSARMRRVPWVTLALITGNVVAFAWQVVALTSANDSAPLGAALVPRELVRQPGWGTAQTIFTSMFLHGDIFHLVGNLWFLWVFGNNVEAAMGPARYPLFYLVSGGAAALAQVAADPGSGIPMVGASGAIAGVLGAYFVLFPRAWVATLIPIVPFLLMPIVRMPAWIFLLAWFAMQGIGATSGGGGVAWMAHVGGFAAGALLTVGFARGIRRSRRRRG